MFCQLDFHLIAKRKQNNLHIIIKLNPIRIDLTKNNESKSSVIEFKPNLGGLPIQTTIVALSTGGPRPGARQLSRVALEELIVIFCESNYK